jgi:murein DD-endopeptidase MepM/ murein hydrolase activator NlpD
VREALLALLGLLFFAASPAAASPAASAAAEAAEPSYPALGSLGPDDFIYRQHQELLAASYAALQNGKEPPELVIYAYVFRGQAKPSERSSIDIFSLAARLNLPYETLATLNRLDRAREFLAGERVLVPSVPGIFAAESPLSDLDYLLSYRGAENARILPFAGTGRPQRLRFYPGARFNAEERALFLGLLFRFPLPMGRLSSGFGFRSSPISGKMASHAGIDLAAQAGTDVYAAREGVVEEAGVDPVLGEFIVIAHSGGWSTVYGHLSGRRVRLNDKVESGMIIGSVGSTGLSTGPHLHFEVRNRGEPRDPESLIPRGKR